MAAERSADSHRIRSLAVTIVVHHTEDTIVILNEMVHDSRIIPIDGTPRPGIKSWIGESRGRWEGDTLAN